MESHLESCGYFHAHRLGYDFFSAIMFVLIIKKGYNWFSGYKFQRDPCGFDILADGTHGTGGWIDHQHMEAIFDIGQSKDLTGTILGKLKEAVDTMIQMVSDFAQAVKGLSKPTEKVEKGSS